MGVFLRMIRDRKRWHTHVFTSTYTADVSGVCSAMYELGGMTILHDPSGCNSTYTTHDEPRWYDSKSLMFVSGLDEMTAVMGDDSVLIRDAVRAAADLKPRFITLCGASIPHIISFDFRGVARLIERETGIPVIPVATDGLRSYVSGAGLAFREWIRRFAEPGPGAGPASSVSSASSDRSGLETGMSRGERLLKYGVNLLGVTPVDFSRQEIVDAMKKTFTDAGIPVNTCFAMGDTFENLTQVNRGAVNVIVSSAGRIPARYLKGTAGIPSVEGLPMGMAMADRLLDAVRHTAEDGRDRKIFPSSESSDPSAENLAPSPACGVLVIGEEIWARTMAEALNSGSFCRKEALRAEALWPDPEEGLDEDLLMERVNGARYVIADPLFRTVLRNPETRLIEFPHEGYSGRIFRSRIPVFACPDFDPDSLLRQQAL